MIKMRIFILSCIGAFFLVNCASTNETNVSTNKSNGLIEDPSDSLVNRKKVRLDSLKLIKFNPGAQKNSVVNPSKSKREKGL